MRLLRLWTVLMGAWCAAGCSSDPAAPGSEPVESAWVWQPVEGTRCMNDTPTGFALNVNEASDRLLIFLEPGNACFNEASCPQAANRDGFGESDMQALLLFGSIIGREGILDRDASWNPFRDANMLFIPYCTGDVHAGAQPDGFLGCSRPDQAGEDFPCVHAGFNNVALDLEAAKAQLPAISEVVLAGSSAGGFGATWNLPQVAAAFPDAALTMINDSGPGLGDDVMRPCLQQTWRDVWNLEATLPAACAACSEGAGGLSNLQAHLAAAYPDARFGLVSSAEDEVIRYFFGFGYSETCAAEADVPGRDFRQGLLDLRGSLGDSWRFFLLEGASHPQLLADLSQVAGRDTTGTDVTLADWLGALADDAGPPADVLVPPP